ncbi:MAG: phosphoglycerate dehydrogenase [Armatimonadetes bacterium]|nr:phosphoglycerate dehydrogenase [Armatimonadota bacterium]
MPKVLVADKLSPDGIEVLKQTADVDVRTGLPREELIACIGEYDGLVVRSATKVTADVIAAANKLKIIGRAGVGVDNIDVPAATARGIVVVNSPEGNTIAAAELTMALLLALSRSIPTADASLKHGEWERSKYVGVEVYNKTLGIIGLGKIGREVAKRAQAFGMETLGYDPFLSADVAKNIGVRLLELADLLKQSDYITLHLPKNKETEGLISSAQFAMMKDGARIVNVARGGIIDEAALAEALKQGKVAGAAVDVYSQEPVSLDNPLLSAPNIVTTPHLGASTAEAQNKVAVDVAEQIVDYFNGKPARAAVNMPAVSAEVLARISPYLTLAERIGALMTQTVEGRIEGIEVTYCGDLANEETGPVTRAVLAGILRPMLSERVNFVNAPMTAEARGIRVTESRSSTMGDFTSLLCVTAHTDKGEKEITGTIFGKSDIRIIRIDGYRIDLMPEGTMLVAPHIDKPGIIGKVGTILGNRGINIGGMYVGREKAGSRAIMVLSVDSSIPDDAMREIVRVDGIENVKQVTFQTE